MMKWHHYLMCFFGGAFVANFVPHFVNGISGRKFPTPFNAMFGQPAPPIGLSPAPANVVWALVNLAIGYVLLRYGRFFEVKSWTNTIVVFLGFALMSLMLANAFTAVPQ